MKDLADTICALSTPPGRSGLAVVRVSGSQSIALLHQFFVTKRNYDSLPSRRATLGKIINPIKGYTIDEAIAVFFNAPNTYTGEDMVEVSMHGSPVLITELLECLCAMGSRLAEPGEFTMRAFLNGRLDLTQAEAINDIIGATTLYQAQVAARQHSGALSQELKPVKDRIIEIIANLESAVEFVEEDLGLASREAMAAQLSLVRIQLEEWIKLYRSGRIVREGFSLAIVGKPNVGKSSLFNSLLAKDRSIVSEMPGTTRDLVSEYLNIEGIPVRLLDTAGIQSTADHIERLGIDRSFQAIADADAVLLVLDASRPCGEEDMELRNSLGGFSCIAVMNKSDLVSRWSTDEKKEFAGEWQWIDVSAKMGSGVRELRTAMLSGLLGMDNARTDSVLITNIRHVHCLESAEEQLELAGKVLQEGLSEEFALVHLHNGLKKIGEITGETSVDDLLQEIFSRFCIGK